tara:strand:+ start:77 stop:376 length:300 start_codon:yes stop_codon:yes gene_type:complete
MKTVKTSYKCHAFVCINEREEGMVSCSNGNSMETAARLKEQIGLLKLNQNGLVRVSKSQCLGPCDKGSVVMLYPQNTMFTNVTPNDVGEIVDKIQDAIL